MTQRVAVRGTEIELNLLLNEGRKCSRIKKRYPMLALSETHLKNTIGW